VRARACVPLCYCLWLSKEPFRLPGITESY